MVPRSCLVAGVVLALAASAAPAAGRGGDAKAGEAIYSRCLACHALEHDRTGPRHCGLFGRRAGSGPAFDYSAAMKRSAIVWNRATLDRFLRDPLAVVPGTTMGYGGVADATERADLIAYLDEANRSARCRK